MNKEERICLWCGKMFLAYPCEIKKGGGKFCSRSCATTYRNTFDNPAKSAEVRAKISQNHADVSGAKNPMYMKRGESAPSYIDGRNSFTGETYRKMLLASGRKQECEVCKSTERLCVHHIDGDHRNNVLENLTWVCYRCHNFIKHAPDRDEKGRFVGKNNLKEVI
jgi:hypothetical protein